MRWVIEILALISISLILISVIILPWPANIIITGMLVAAIAADSVYSWRVKKQEQDASPLDPDHGIPPDTSVKNTKQDSPY